MQSDQETISSKDTLYKPRDIMTDFLQPTSPAKDRESYSTPSSPVMKPRLFRSKKHSSFRGDYKIEQEKDPLPSQPKSPRSLMKTLKERFHSPKPSSHEPFRKLMIQVGPEDDVVEGDFISKPSSHSPLLQQPSILVSQTDETPNNDHKPTNTLEESVPLKVTPHLMMDRARLRNDPSSSSMESGYTSDISQTHLSMDQYKSTDSLQGVFEHGKVGVKVFTQHNSDVRLGRHMEQVTKVYSDCPEIPHPQCSPEFKRNDKHPKTLHHVQRSVINPLTDISIDSESHYLRQEDVRRSDGVISSTNPPLSPSFNRSGSLSRPSPPSTRSRRSSIVGTKYYRVTPRKYLKKSRATSALHLSEVLSDDDDSLNGNLRKLKISVSRSSRRLSSSSRDEDYLSESLELYPALHSSTPKKGSHGKDTDNDGVNESTRHEAFSYPWSSIAGQTVDHQSAAHEMAMQQWFREKVQTLVQEKLEEILENIQRKNEHFRAQMTEEYSQLHKKMDDLDLKIRKTNSEPVKLVAGRAESINISLNLSTERSMSMSVLPSERDQFNTHSYPPFHSQRCMNVKLPSELPCKQVHQKVLRDLSNEVPWWKFLARALEVPDNAIERIYLDYQNDSREQCYQMLRKWTQINGQNATYQHLGRALKTEVEEAYPKYVDIVTSYLS